MTMETAAITLLLLTAAAYTMWAAAWWPVIDDPGHYARKRFDELAHVTWAQGLPIEVDWERRL